MATKAIKDMKNNKEAGVDQYFRSNDRNGGINLEIAQTEALIHIAEQLEKISGLLAVIAKPYQDQPTKTTTQKK
jgi:hypothetical protein